MSDYPMLISNKLHSFRNFTLQIYILFFHISAILILFIPRKMMFFVGNVMTTYYLKNKMLCTVK